MVVLVQYQKIQQFLFHTLSQCIKNQRTSITSTETEDKTFPYYVLYQTSFRQNYVSLKVTLKMKIRRK